VRIKKIGGVNADKGMLSNLLKYLFAQRRKMILNGLAAAENISKERAEEILKQCGIAPTLRPENIPPSKFVELCQNIAKLNK
jgi:16S rRNA A1518/A1519 N6-dimethyltransferase RsmA/KsgA/DIM1 with predicted DNA glycosylase/AP lyase activity